MQNHIITITGSNPATGDLSLSDHGKTNVDPGETVTWNIGQGSGVSAITSIVNKPSSIDVFSDGPSPVGGSTNWKGTVNPNVARGSRELYNIVWKDSAGAVHTFDPEIIINQ